MAKVKNYKGQEFNVEFGIPFATNYGLHFMLFPSDDSNVQVFREEMGGFYAPMLRIHELNIGCTIFVLNEQPMENELPLYPTDNEFDLHEIYKMVANGECAIKGNAANLEKALKVIVNRYNRNMGYDYKVYHYETLKEIDVVCNPTNAIITDITMVANAFLNVKSNDVVVVISDFYPTKISVRYRNARFKRNVDTMTLRLVGGFETPSEIVERKTA